MNKELVVLNALKENGYDVKNIERTVLGHNDVYEFKCGSTNYYAKASFNIDTSNKQQKELVFYNYIKNSNIAFPICEKCQIIKTNEVQLLIKTGIDGESLYDSNNYSDDIFLSIANDMKQLHQKECNQDYESILKDNLEEINSCLNYLKDNEIFFDGDKLLKALISLSTPFINIVKPVFIHGDIGFANVIIKDNKVVGYIDYEWSRVDDPIADLPSLLLWMKGNNISPNNFIKYYNLNNDIPFFLERLSFNLIHRSIVRLCNMLKGGNKDIYVINSSIELFNDLINGQDVIGYLTKGKINPGIYYFNINYFCNNKCLFCFSHNTSEKNKDLSMSVLDFNNVLFKAKINIDDKIIINGGEPTLNEDFYSILSSASEKNVCRVDVYSNGRIIDTNRLTTIKNIDKVHFIIPVHGDESIHDKITQVKGSYNNTLSTLKKMNGIHYSIKFIINKDMIDTGFSIREFIKENNFHPERVFLARQNTTIVSKKNSFISPNKSLEKKYLEETIKSLNNIESEIVLLDYPICYFKYRFINKPQVDYDFYFSDCSHTLIKRIYKKDLLMNKKCSSCKYKKQCQYMSTTYYLLKYQDDSLSLELE